MTLNELSISFNKSLIKSGINGLAKSVNLSPTIITSVIADLGIKNYYPKAKLVFLDGRYKIIGWDKWQIIDSIVYDIIKKQYEKEYTDCDDKAYAHKYWTWRIFGISQFIVHGHRYDRTGKWLDGHFWNAKISDNKLYFLEPEGIKSVEVQKGKPVFIGEKEYRPLTWEF